MKISGYNGADEDEIMDNVYGRYSKEGRTTSGHKTGQKLLMKDDAKLAAGTVLEAAHKLAPSAVPAYLEANFKKPWNHFDQTTRDGSDTRRPTPSRDSWTEPSTSSPVPQDPLVTSPPVAPPILSHTQPTPRRSQLVVSEEGDDRADQLSNHTNEEARN